MTTPITSAPDERLPQTTSMTDFDSTIKHTESGLSQTAQAVEDITFGSVAGAFGKVLEYPFDTVKVRLQSRNQDVYKNALDCFKKSIRADGVVRGLYRGLSAPIVGAAVETSCLFFTYRISQDLLMKTVYRDKRRSEDLGMDALLVAGAMSGFFTSFALTPIELVKCQMQVPLSPGSCHGPGVRAVIGNVFRHNGLRGFWHGQSGTLIREAGGSAAWFGAYEGTKKFFKSRSSQARVPPSTPGAPAEGQAGPDLPMWQLAIAGACAGVSYNFAFYPADTIKSRMQTVQVGLKETENCQKTPPSALKVGTTLSPSYVPQTRQPLDFLATTKLIWQESGLRGMYRGCAITVGRSALSSPIIFCTFETLKRWRERLL